MIILSFNMDKIPQTNVTRKNVETLYFGAEKVLEGSLDSKLCLNYEITTPNYFNKTCSLAQL